MDEAETKADRKPMNAAQSTSQGAKGLPAFWTVVLEMYLPAEVPIASWNIVPMKKSKSAKELSSSRAPFVQLYEEVVDRKLPLSFVT